MDSPSLIRNVSMLGISTAFFVSGVGLSAAHLTIPSLCTMPSKPALHVFKALFHDGATVVVPTGILSTTCFAAAAYMTPTSPASGVLKSVRARFVAAAVFSVLSLPYTQLVMMEGISVLLACADDDAARAKVGDPTIVQLLQAWKIQALTRSVFFAIAGALGWSVL